MVLHNPSAQVKGRTIRFHWTEGPTRGTTQEHDFHLDGTVEWRSVGGGKDDHKPVRPAERPKYSSVEVVDDVWLVSYRAASGYTLTVALKFEDGSMVGVASNERNWFPVRGRFEVSA